MALELKIRVTQIDSNYTFFIVEDENYTLDTDKQYGQGANPQRADMGLFVYVTKKEVGDDLDTLIFGETNNTDPVNASSWQVDYSEDNWYEHILIGAVTWDSGTAYVANDVVHFNNRLFKGIAPVVSVDPQSGTDEWLDVTGDHVDVITNATSTYTYTTTLNDGRLEISSLSFAKMIATSSKNGQCLNCDHDNTERRDLIKFHLNAAQVACDQQLYTQMQYNIVTLKDLTGES